MAATLDYLSGGRYGMGVGAGWMQEEYDALGVPFAERFRLTDEYLSVIRELFEGGGPYEGSTISFPALNFELKPIQRPLPVYIGSGNGPLSLRRVARYGQGWTPHGIELDDTPQALRNLEELMVAEGREGEKLVVEGVGGSVHSKHSSPDQLLGRLQKMASVGYDSAVIDFGQLRSTSLPEVAEAMSWFAREVMSEASDF
jgi:alkanesulfonate monooxygenase SsuD/methylene tetrahydromethanopterin reductase-like flavin-dependent oxidoreductase (luciferase family)